MTDTEGDCAEWSFPAVPGSVRSARHAVRDALHVWGLDAAVGDVAVLLVSELVTNSLRYADGPIGVRLVRPQPDGEGPGSRTAGQALLVEVSDPLPDAPTERMAGPEDEGGAGCSSWLVLRAAGGPGAERVARRCGSSSLSLVRSGRGRTAIIGGQAEPG